MRDPSSRGVQDRRREVRVVAASPGGTTGAMTTNNAGQGTGEISAPVGVVGAGIVGLAVARQLANGRGAGQGLREGRRRRHPSDRPQLRGGARRDLLRAGLGQGPDDQAGRLSCCATTARSAAWVYDERGKLVVARDEAETVKLRELERRSFRRRGARRPAWLSGAEELRA